MNFYRTESFVWGRSENRLVGFRVSDSSAWIFTELPVDDLTKLFSNPQSIAALEAEILKIHPENPVNRKNLETYWRTPKTAISALNMNLTDQCNLACVYCYARGGNYERIHQKMDPETAIWGLQQALKRADPDREFRLELFGGEPLLNLDTIEKILDFEATFEAWKTHREGTVNRISTNLTTLEPKAVDLLKQGKIIVSVSIDGVSHIQDDQRPFKNGTGSYATIMENLRTLRQKNPNGIMVARMTVFHHDKDLLTSIREFVQTDIFDYVSIYPASLFAETGDQGKSHFSGIFREQFLAFAAEYPLLVGKGRFKGCLELNRYSEAILTGKTVLNHCRAGAGYFTFSPDRSVHPCHRFVGDPKMNLGAFDWSQDSLVQNLKSWQTPVDHREVCRDCQLKFLCGGGCKQQQFVATGSLLGNDPRVCAFSNLLFEAAISVATLPAPESEPWIKALRASFGELTRLFVFCGQPTVKCHRSLPKGPRKIHFTGNDIFVQALNWETPEP